MHRPFKSFPTALAPLSPILLCERSKTKNIATKMSRILSHLPPNQCLLCVAAWYTIIILKYSLVIYEEKTQEITPVKELWICDPNNIIVVKFGELLL